MCKNPPCPNGCRALLPGGRSRKQHLVRTYIRILDEKRRQRSVPVGWWCPGCHLFRTEIA